MSIHLKGVRHSQQTSVTKIARSKTIIYGVNKLIKKFSGIIVLTVLAMVLVACGSKENSSGGASGGEKTIKLGTVLQDGTTQVDGLYKMKEYIEEETNGELKVEIYTNGQLGDEQEVAESTQDGSIEATAVSSIIVANLVPEYGVWSYPFMVPSFEAGNEVLGGETAREILDQAENVRLKGLAFFNQGHYMITNNKGPIETMADLKGLKIRTMQNSMLLDTYSALSANPTPMSYSEVYTGLQQGVIEGQVNPPSEIYEMKFHEPQKYISSTTEFIGVFSVIMNLDFYNGLTEEQQKIVDEGAKIAQDYQAEKGFESENEYLEKIIADGLEFNEISKEARQEMIEATQKVIDNTASDSEKEFIEKIREEMKAFE